VSVAGEKHLIISRVPTKSVLHLFRKSLQKEAGAELWILWTGGGE